MSKTDITDETYGISQLDNDFSHLISRSNTIINPTKHNKNNEQVQNSSQTLRTSNRYKNFWKNKNNDTKRIQDIFSLPNESKCSSNLNNNSGIGLTNSDKKTTTNTTSTLETLDSVLINKNKSNGQTSSPLSLYSDCDKFYGVEMPDISLANQILDTGLESKSSCEKKDMVISSPISKFLYKMLNGSSSSTFNKDHNHIKKDKIRKSCNSSPTHSYHSLHFLKSPYIDTEINDLLDSCLERVEKIDFEHPNYFTGSLIVHIKSMKKIFNNENLMKGTILRKKSVNDSNYQMILDNWKLAISSMEIFIDGLEKQRYLLSLEDEFSEKISKLEKLNEEANSKQHHYHYNKNTTYKHKSANMYETVRDCDIPEKYRINLKKDLYSYEHNKRENNDERDDLDTFLDDLNNRLQHVSEMEIL